LVYLRPIVVLSAVSYTVSQPLPNAISLPHAADF
jgi:hypothetical protein